MTDSHAYPDLERKPGVSNWVDAKGGLPDYIERIAKHLHYESKMKIGHAIATAVNTVKRWCHGGTVSKTGGPTVANHVSAATVAKACKALAEWNAKKAHASLSLGLDRDAHSDRDFAEAFAEQLRAMGVGVATSAGDCDWDEDAYELALSQERAARGIEAPSEEPLYMAAESPGELTDIEAREERSRLERYLRSFKRYDGMSGLDMYASDRIEFPAGYVVEPDHRGSFILLGPTGECCGWGADATDLVHAYQVERYGD